MAFDLPENSHVQAMIQFVDAGGNVLPVPSGATASWSSSDSSVGTVVADPSDATGMTGLVTSSLKAGVFTVQLSVDVPGDPASPYTGVGGDVTVGVGKLSAIDITFGPVSANP